MTQTANFVVTARIKEHNSVAGLRSDGGLVEAVNEKVQEMLDAAQERAKLNGRSTVRPQDL